MPPDAMRRGHHVTRHCAAAWFLAAACTAPQDRAGASNVVARIDSSATRSGVEGTGPGAIGAVVASPTSPSVSPSADSAAALDQRFQAERAVVNAAALRLDSMPPAARRTAAYAARYDSLRGLTLRADSLRRARDRMRGRDQGSGTRNEKAGAKRAPASAP